MMAIGVRQDGFTLIELLMAIVILAILLTIAVPSFRTAIQNNQVSVQGNELVTAFQLARSEALKRRVSVVVCASSDGETCTGDWGNGWIVVEDNATPGNNNLVLGQVIRNWDGLRRGATLTVSGGAAANNAVRFDPRGSIDPRTTSIGNNTFPIDLLLEIPDCSGNQAREIRLNRSGGLSSQRVACT